VDGFGGASGNTHLTLAFAPPPDPPINDSFTNRIELTGASVSITSTNTAATLEPGEPQHADKNGGLSVWWTWTAPTNGTATLSTSGSDFDTLLAVYTGDSISNLVPVASNDDYMGTDSRVIFMATAGRAYQFAVDGFYGAMGNLALSVDLAPSDPITPAANDAFANRAVLSGANVTTSGSSAGATKEAGEPKHAGNSGGSSLWWTWTAPSHGSLTIATPNSDFNTVLAVYSGSSVSALSLAASNDDGDADGTSSLTFTVVSDGVYQIAVDGFGGAFGSVALSLSFVPAPNQPPVAANDSTNTVEDVSVTIKALLNDSDGDGDTLTITSVSPTNGTASISGANVVFTPAANFVGTATIGYSIGDGNGGNANALITITVSAANDPPVAVNDSTNTVEDVAVTIQALVNDSDVDGNPLTITSVNPTNGTASISGATVVFTPAANFVGIATIGYSISDGNGGNADALITVSVANNNPPVAVNDATNTVEDAAVTIQALLNDSDVDGDPLTITSVSPTNGTASISGANVLFTPAANFVGTATIGYSISDGNGGSANALITVTVTPAAISPVLQINRSGSSVIVSWPTWASDFVLEFSTNLPPGASWFPLTNGVVTVGESFVRTNNASAPRSFYRLRHQ
jgi:hypothetical protein